MKIDPHIFRAYDIRGKAHTQLSAEACRLIGRGFGTTLRRMYDKEHPIVIVGRDARTHGPELEAAIIAGLVASGCRILHIGAMPSPVNYFTLCAVDADGGVHVTASHNPKEDNGAKLQIRGAEAFSGNDLQKLRSQIDSGDFLSGKGSVEIFDAAVPYKKHLKLLFKDLGRNLTVAVDGGNGIAGPVNCDVLRSIGAEVIELYTEPDGEFPNHPADPSKHATLRDLQAKVKETNADLGFAFDGDGDRLGIVDEKGAIWSSDYVLLLLAEDHLQRHRGKPVVFTVSNSGILETEIRRWGGASVMCKVGHSFVEHAMRKHGALLGGEQSGHFFCAEDYYGFDDALVAALRTLSILKHAGGKPFSELMAAFPTVFQAPELRPRCADEAKGKVIASAAKHFKKSHPVNTLDGVRIDFGDGAWAGIRQSNTSPCVSVCMEARTSERLKEIQDIVLKHLKTYKEIEFV